MSHSSLILLSETATPSHLATALDHTPDGERLLILPPHLQEFVGTEPALNLNFPGEALRLQLIDNATTALCPQTILADLSSLELIAPSLPRSPQLRRVILLRSGADKKKSVRAATARFEDSHIIHIEAEAGTP